MLSDYRMLINGKWEDAHSGEQFDVINPANGQVIARVSLGDELDARQALESAQKAFKTWSRMSAFERAKYLHACADKVRQQHQEIAIWLTKEQGKPLNEALSEVRGAADALDFFAEEAIRTYGEVMPTLSNNRFSFVIKQPVGVVSAITPWNYPITLLSWKLGPALSAGCTIVVKPSSYTPISSLLFADACMEADLPPGVFNIVTGSGNIVGRELVRNPISRKVAFTGKTETGIDIATMAAAGLKRATLELGGHSPFIVLADADLDLAAKHAAYRAFRNMGQICNSINRIYVEKRVSEEFISKIIEVTSKYRIGDGLADPSVDLGPMCTPEGVETTKVHIADALKKGAKIAFGGKKPEGPQYENGLFFEPTILIDVDHSMKVMQEETFGPIAPIMQVEDFDDAIARANDSPYGLVGYVYTRDLHKAMMAVEQLECGTVGINNVSGGEYAYPYGGWKASGLGIENSHYGLEEYLLIKHVRIDW